MLIKGTDMLGLPTDDPTDPLRLADWLEIVAVLSRDGNSSQGDLERAFRRAALAEYGDDESVERKLLDVFNELERRAQAAGAAYPFDIGYGVIQLRSRWEDFPAYVFCLCLSYFDLTATGHAPKLFEQVSCLAAKGYLEGDAVGFGWPRSDLPTSFAEAVTELCKRIGEGVGFRQQPELDRKDDKLDVVAWRDFADRQPSKLILFGQCAAGRNWEGKLGELQPEAFYKQWMQVPPLSPPVKSFFVPHRIHSGNWTYVANNAGILFERCRIAFWAHQQVADYNPHISWVRELLSNVTA